MAAYIVFTRYATKDPEAMKVYSGKAGATMAGHPVKPLVAYGAIETLEGPPAEGVVIVEFPTMEAAKAWYDSDAYKEAREHRFKGSDYNVVLVQGL